MPGSDAPRKREDTSWPEHEGRTLSAAERQRRSRAKKRGQDPDSVVPRRTGLPDVPDGPAPGAPEQPAEIPSDPEGTGTEMPRDPSVRDAVRRSLADWGKTQDPLAAMAVGLAKAFDDAVKDGAGGVAASVSEKLTNTLDRLRPATGSGAVPADPDSTAKVTDPADLISRRKARLAEAAGRQ